MKKKTLQFLTKVWRWLLAADVGVPNGTCGSDPISPVAFTPPGRVVNTEIYARPILNALKETTETTYETSDGLVTRHEKPEYKGTCCEKVIERPYAYCSIETCLKMICGPQHHFLCYICGRSLCVKCRKFFTNTRDPEGGMVPLCPDHYKIADQTGLVDGKWE